MNGLSLGEGTGTVVIIDEAGCIPSYEFLGLSRLERNIIGLVCVGDKHQLAPYDSTQFSGRRHSNRSYGRQGSFDRARRTMKTSTPTQSLLDVSGLTVEDGAKIKLTTQYRVPRDIAAVLNDRIYNGDYNTAEICKSPDRGFQFVHVPEDHDSSKYINGNEVSFCMEMFRQLQNRGETSIMILTPYKKQQREIQFQLKKRGINVDEIRVLSIDQCQGQEADYVILSMVQKPTRFLNKNRFNVALSRVRKKLYLCADKTKFREASNNFEWDCSLIASDLLKLAASDPGVQFGVRPSRFA